MNKRSLLISVLALALSTTAWAERTLLVEDDTRAFLDAPFECGEPASVTVESSQHEWFRQDAPALQRLVDGVSALLAFECPDIREIQVQGRLKGMDTVVYRGIATRGSEWWLDVRESIRSADDVPNAGPTEAQVPSGHLAVAGLDTGMTVEEAKDAVSSAFEIEPVYDASRRSLRFESGGCPHGFDPDSSTSRPQVGWRCFQGLFTDEAPPRLSRFQLMQVTHQTEQDVVRLLEERFGPAKTRWVTNKRSGSLWGIAREVIHLAWGDIAGTEPADSGRPQPIYELEASVDELDGRAITVLKRNAMAETARPPARMDLKL